MYPFIGRPIQTIYTPLTKNIKKEFAIISDQLSPTGIRCEGKQFPHIEVTQCYRHYMYEWTSLENRVGRQVSEEEIWDHANAEYDH